MTKIVVNGTFDILHPGHVEMLNYARSLGAYLLVLIDSDRRVKELKGNTRPVNNQRDRQFLLKNLKAVNDVWIFDNDKELVEFLDSSSIIYVSMGTLVGMDEVFVQKLLGAFSSFSFFIFCAHCSVSRISRRDSVGGG